MKKDWVNIPFAPRKWPFFYGWVILAATTVGTIMSIPGQTIGVGVFTDYLVEALGVSTLNLSAAYAVGTITSSLFLPFAGQLMDRWGARKMVVFSAAGLGASMVFLSRLDAIARMEQLRSFLFIMLVCSLCFLAMRFFGQGCLTMVSRVSLGKWFNHRRGLAAGIASVFTAIAFTGGPYALNILVAGFGWRGAALLLAGIVGMGMSLLGWIFYRDNPEACGLEMDGVDDPRWHQKMAARIPETRKEFTRGEALKTFTFWAYAMGPGIHSLVGTAVFFHLTALGAEMGLTRDETYRVIAFMPIFGISASFLGGWISDKVDLRWILGSLVLFIALGNIGVLFLSTLWGAGLFIFGFGAAGGLFSTIMTVAYPRFFGRLHLGAITGIAMSLLVFASALGPVLFSLGHRFTGSFREVIAACLVMPTFALVAAFWARNPQDSVLRNG